MPRAWLRVVPKAGVVIIQLKVKKVSILTGHGQDRISLTLDAPTPYPECGYEAEAVIETRAGYGEQWCRDVLGIDAPEVINARTGEVKNR